MEKKWALPFYAPIHSHLLPPTPIHFHPLPPTPIHCHPLPPTATEAISPSKSTTERVKKSIDSCLTKNEFTDTFTVDHLSKLNSDSTNILSRLSPIDNVGLTYFEKYLKASQMEGKDFLGIPLCDGVHFQG